MTGGQVKGERTEQKEREDGRVGAVLPSEQSFLSAVHVDFFNVNDPTILKRLK